MPLAPGRSSDWLSLPVLPPLASWTVGGDGITLAFDGPASGLAPEQPIEVVGRHYTDALQGAPELRALIARALAGHPAAAIVPAWGALWFALARPEFGACGSVLRVHGTSLLLPGGVEVPGEETQSWTCTRATHIAGALVRPGDMIGFDGEEYSHTRFFAREVGDAILRRRAASFEPAQLPELHAPETPPQPAGARPPLRVLP